MVFRLGLGLSDLRERRIWAQANSPNTKIRYQRLSRGNAGFTFEAIKNAKVLSHRGSPFRLLKPLSEAADEKRMNQLLSLLSETELKEMVTEAHQDNLQPWGLDKPVYTIALENPNWKSPVTVLMNPVLEAPGTFYVTRSDVLWVGRFASSRFEQLDFDLNGVIDETFIFFSVAESTSLGSVGYKTRSFDFRKEMGWVRDAGATARHGARNAHVSST